MNNFDFDLTRFSEPEINEEDLNMEEPLGLKPDGQTARFPIVWNGKGRYVAGSLKIINNKTNQELSSDQYAEDDSGLFYTFMGTLPTGSYTDYTIKYKVREEDYRFSTGLNSTTPGEEYFLFPNWKNIAGLGDGFWVGKYLASRSDATATDKGTSEVPQSKKGVCAITDITFPDAQTMISNRTDGFHMMMNREWTNIAYWIDHFKLQVEGNMQMYTDPSVFEQNLDEIYDPGNNNKSTLPGLGPVSWRHNLKEDGIADLVGNLWEMIDGIKIDYRREDKSLTGVYVFGANNMYPDTLDDTTCLIKLPEEIATIDFNIDQIYEGYENIEGLPINMTTSIYYAPKRDASNLDSIESISAAANPNRPYSARRLGYMFTDKNVSMWYLGLHSHNEGHAWSDGFRLCKTLV